MEVIGEYVYPFLNDGTCCNSVFLQRYVSLWIAEPSADERRFLVRRPRRAFGIR